MLKRFPLSIVSVILVSALYTSAQDSVPTTQPAWKLSVLTNLTLTLNSYSDNWTGGEFSAFSWAWQFTGTADRAFAKWFTNKNTLKLAFGQTAIEAKKTDGSKEWQSLKKSSDLIDFESVGRFTLQAFVNPFIGVRAVTQFYDMRVPGHDYFGNPLVLTESFGVIRDILKGQLVTWSARLGGAVRQTIERNEFIPDSLLPVPNSLMPHNYTNDGGVEFVTDFKAASKDNRLSYITQFKLYEALFSSIAGKQEGLPSENFWRYPDISWENTVGITLTKYVMLNLFAQLLYDREIEESVRYRETVGLALTYTFAN